MKESMSKAHKPSELQDSAKPENEDELSESSSDESVSEESSISESFILD